ncbi:MAG TPA: DsbA family protein [Terriglobia bacterium]|nr:DsbA family protein [Terriglobia bacterium]
MFWGRKPDSYVVINEGNAYLPSGGLLVILVASVLWLGGTSLQAQPKGGAAIGTERLVHFLRERYAIPQTVKIAMDPLQTSAFAGFSEATVVTGDGPEKKTQKVYVTQDGRFLVLGTLVKLGSDLQSELVKQVRTNFKLPMSTPLTAGPLVKSKFAEFQQIKVSSNDGKSQDFFVSHGDLVVFGDVLLIESNLRQKALQTMVMRDQPGVGPTSAPVTIVEYADLQCPMCARFHAFLESELLPRYGDKVRVVFKEFPLAMHDWSTTAAIADQCSYQISPGDFVAFRSLIFRHQDAISPANVREALLQYGEEAGIDRDKLAACIDSKASLPRVEENKREGEKLDINSTPTSFINGRIVVGAPPPEQYFALVDEALRAGK